MSAHVEKSHAWGLANFPSYFSFRVLVVFFIFIVILTSFEVFLVLVALLVDCSGLKLSFVAGSESIHPHLQALRLL